MIRIGSYMWLVGASIGLSPLTYTSAVTEERIREMTVRSLKFLTTYQANVADHHRTGTIDEGEKKIFWDTWIGSFYTAGKNLPELYNSVEKYWRYTSDLASSNEDNLSPLVIALQTKLEASELSFYYSACLMHSHYVRGYNSEHCQNIAANLLIFSYIGTDKLIEKFLSIAGSSLSADNISDIKEFQETVTASYNRLKYILRAKEHFVPKLSEDTFEEYLSDMAHTHDPLLRTAERLSIRIMFGHYPVTVQEKGYKPDWCDAGFLKSMWKKAEDINKRLTKVSTEGGTSYDITRAMHDIVFQRTEIWNVSQQDFAKELDEIKLKHLEIHITEGEFSVNLN